MINDIIDKINDTLSECFRVENSVYYNLSEVVEVNDKRSPVASVDGKLVKICLDDSVNLKLYHRIIRYDFTEAEEFSFGRISSYLINASVKMIVIIKTDLSESNKNFNAINMSLIIPSKVHLEDYKFINTQITTVTNDHDTIIAREWKTIDYSKHKCKFSVYEVNYNIRALTCKLSCADFQSVEGSPALQE